MNLTEPDVLTTIEDSNYTLSKVYQHALKALPFWDDKFDSIEAAYQYLKGLNNDEDNRGQIAGKN